MISTVHAVESLTSKSMPAKGERGRIGTLEKPQCGCGFVEGSGRVWFGLVLDHIRGEEREIQDAANNN
jgi:hypothetical protein